ncbi:unnamed protein product [Caenorhabditis auriculariae]|uniref:Uncharacterized protein n=1 Tax=Caenorhabditis auriculariae TaxID=2777116 RepID=A0A8S1HPW8_9PELO|nr:unnamed protein product [Caenorhabditis auriculariae]
MASKENGDPNLGGYKKPKIMAFRTFPIASTILKVFLAIVSIGQISTIVALRWGKIRKWKGMFDEKHQIAIDLAEGRDWMVFACTVFVGICFWKLGSGVSSLLLANRHQRLMNALRAQTRQRHSAAVANIHRDFELRAKMFASENPSVAPQVLRTIPKEISKALLVHGTPRF